MLTSMPSNSNLTTGTYASSTACKGEDNCLRKHLSLL